jgi:hypothetical protein
MILLDLMEFLLDFFMGWGWGCGDHDD